MIHRVIQGLLASWVNRITSDIEDLAHLQLELRERSESPGVMAPAH